MYRFDLNHCTKSAEYGRLWRRFISNLHIQVSHTNGQSLKILIDVVMNRLVGMSIKYRTNENLMSVSFSSLPVQSPI